MSVPAVLGRKGIEKIVGLRLLSDEQEGLRQTSDIFNDAAHSVELALGEIR